MNHQVTVDEYRDLLDRLSATDADTEEPDLATLFTPSGHRAALRPDTTVVRGARGVGKTVWFRALQDDQLRHLAAEEYELPQLNRVSTQVGFGTRLSDAYPGPRVLEHLLEQHRDPYLIWSTTIAHALSPETLSGMNWTERVAWIRERPEDYERILREADTKAGRESLTLVVLFDGLDRMHTDRSQADRLVGGVLRLALDLRTSTRNLRAKVFIRPDMWDSSHRHFPDSSKLVANAAELTWTSTNLYGLLFHRLGNVDAPAATHFRSVTGGWLPRPGSATYHKPPASLVGDTAVQQARFVDIAGPYMGQGYRKGHTYTWLPNHLMDGAGQVSPRSFLVALGAAARFTREQRAGHQFALHYEGIRRGVQKASQTRVAEVNEDIPWVSESIEALQGVQVPIERSAVLDRWKSIDLSSRLARLALADDKDENKVRTGPTDPDDHQGLIDQLMDLGVMTSRADGRVDLPDVYRVAFGVGRRGGVPRIS